MNIKLEEKTVLVIQYEVEGVCKQVIKLHDKSNNNISANMRILFSQFEEASITVTLEVTCFFMCLSVYP